MIRTNLIAITAQKNLQASRADLSTALTRLSSGSRINSAKDDAAGLGIANRMTAQIRGLQQAQRNANDGISILQVGGGAADEMMQGLQRMRELTVQALNGVNAPSDLDSIQQEINQRLSEIDRLAKDTDFNGVKLFQQDRSINLQVGANDAEAIEIPLRKVDSSSLNLEGFNINNSELLRVEDRNREANSADLDERGFVGQAAGPDGVVPYALVEENPAAATQDILDRITRVSVDRLAAGAVGGDSAGRIDLSSGGTYFYSPVDGEFNKAVTFDLYSGGISGLPVGSGTPAFYHDSSTKAYVGYLVSGVGYSFHPISSEHVGADGVISMDVSSVPPVSLSWEERVSLGAKSTIGSSSQFAVLHDEAPVSVPAMRAVFENKGGTAFIRTISTPETVTENYRMVKSGGNITFNQYIGPSSTSSGAVYQKAYVEKDSGQITNNRVFSEEFLYLQADGRVTSQSDGEGELFIDEGGMLTEDASRLISEVFVSTKNPISNIDSAIEVLDDLRSTWGGVHNRLEGSIKNMVSTGSNLVASRSRIEDADYAVEVARMTRSKIIQEAGLAILSQANQIPQGVMSLLR